MEFKPYKTEMQKVFVKHVTPYGGFTELPLDASAADIEKAKQSLAEQAADAVKQAMLEYDMFFVRELPEDIIAENKQMYREANVPEELRELWEMLDRRGPLADMSVDRYRHRGIAISWQVGICWENKLTRRVIVEEVTDDESH